MTTLSPVAGREIEYVPCEEDGPAEDMPCRATEAAACLPSATDSEERGETALKEGDVHA